MKSEWPNKKSIAIFYQGGKDLEYVDHCNENKENEGDDIMMQESITVVSWLDTCV